MRIAQISDLHYTHLTWNPFRLLSKRILGHVNWLIKRKCAFSREQLNPLPALFDQLGVDLVLLGGDFTTTSMTEEFEEASRFVGKISQPWIAVPGNHDQYTWRAFRKKHFYQYFSNRRESTTSLQQHRIESHPIGKGLWVIALDTSYATSPYSSKGFFEKDLEDRLDECLSALPQGDFALVLNHYPFFLNDTPRRSLERGKALEAVLRRHSRARLYLHGHTHRQVIADLQESGLPIVLDSGSCAQKETGSWNLIDLDNAGCSVAAWGYGDGWKSIRTERFEWKR